MKGDNRQQHKADRHKIFLTNKIKLLMETFIQDTLMTCKR